MESKAVQYSKLQFTKTTNSPPTLKYKRHLLILNKKKLLNEKKIQSKNECSKFINSQEKKYKKPAHSKTSNVTRTLDKRGFPDVWNFGLWLI